MPCPKIKKQFKQYSFVRVSKAEIFVCVWLSVSLSLCVCVCLSDCVWLDLTICEFVYVYLYLCLYLCLYLYLCLSASVSELLSLWLYLWLGLCRVWLWMCIFQKFILTAVKTRNTPQRDIETVIWIFSFSSVHECTASKLLFVRLRHFELSFKLHDSWRIPTIMEGGGKKKSKLCCVCACVCLCACLCGYVCLCLWVRMGRFDRGVTICGPGCLYVRVQFHEKNSLTWQPKASYHSRRYSPLLTKLCFSGDFDWGRGRE